MTTSDLHQRLLHQLDRVKALNTPVPDSLAQNVHVSRTVGTNAEQQHIPAMTDDNPHTTSPAVDSNDKPRQEHRHQVHKTGSISYIGGDLNVECEISDLTSSGAKLRLCNDVTIPSCFDLTILPDNTTKKAQVCWRDNQELGIQFIGEA